ncbi:hypothetical protein [Streptomyces finlayi]|uniref:hypothetical protein n=1 Tax=Streptomyces finlayi TaxID=67296 RepID=UPI0027E5052D|nr:hypothetical protein [Streptomyces finlayi]
MSCRRSSRRRRPRAHEYSWHTPAHAGGVAFLKSAAARAFFDYYGERLFRSDLSISVGELGSLFEHSGPIGEAERNAVRVFGADRTYFVLHGDSTADRMVGHYSVTRDEIALVDRNCHKSVLHGLAPLRWKRGSRPTHWRRGRCRGRRSTRAPNGDAMRLPRGRALPL